MEVTQHGNLILNSICSKLSWEKQKSIFQLNNNFIQCDNEELNCDCKFVVGRNLFFAGLLNLSGTFSLYIHEI